MKKLILAAAVMSTFAGMAYAEDAAGTSSASSGGSGESAP